MAAVVPNDTSKSVLDAGVKPEGVFPATSAAAETIGRRVLETILKYVYNVGIYTEKYQRRKTVIYGVEEKKTKKKWYQPEG